MQMKQNAVHKSQSMNVLFTMLLFLVFVLCALFTVLIGGKVYENISARMEDNYSGSVALGYVANKVRQGDAADMVDVTTIDGTSVLELNQKIGEDTYVTRIYYKDGSIRELFTDAGSGLTLADGLPILECGGIEFERIGSLIKVTARDEGSSTLYLSVRSGGPEDE